MRLAIDASNIKSGGGVTHLVELLRVAEPAASGFDRILVWADQETLSLIEDRVWLEKRTDRALEENFVKRAIWQRFRLSGLAVAAGADLLFVPGGSIVATFRPAVTMSRNMLPFEWKEVKRFGVSATTLKLLALRWVQSSSFRKADGTIFLTQYAYNSILPTIGKLRGRTAVIPHGIEDRFFRKPRPQRPLSDFSPSNPLTIIYVSTVDAYKHQWHVIEAVGALRSEGIPVRLDLYGHARANVLPKLTSAQRRVDPQGEFVRYWGALAHKELDVRYAAADLCVFASSCENMPNILIESMAAGLPIACSDKGPMPEILGDAGVYFDPENAESIAAALRKLALDPTLRAEKAVGASVAARRFSWSRCARETIDFLAEVVQLARPG